VFGSVEPAQSRAKDQLYGLPKISIRRAIECKLHTLLDVGLSYIRLGQVATTRSGSEAQRGYVRWRTDDVVKAI